VNFLNVRQLSLGFPILDVFCSEYGWLLSGSTVSAFASGRGTAASCLACWVRRCQHIVYLGATKCLLKSINCERLTRIGPPFWINSWGRPDSHRTLDVRGRSGKYAYFFSRLFPYSHWAGCAERFHRVPSCRDRSEFWKTYHYSVHLSLCRDMARAFRRCWTVQYPFVIFLLTSERVDAAKTSYLFLSFTLPRLEWSD
jgi:hypothetical protein